MGERLFQMEADIHILYESDFYRVLDFKCRCTECRKSKPEYSDSFSISFVRKGNFLFNVFRHSLDSYTGCVLISKPACERTVTHVHVVPDECTIFDFKNNFYGELLEQYGHVTFFHDRDCHSTLIKTDTEMEFLHYYIWQLIKNGSGSRLQTDQLVLQMAGKVLGDVTDYVPDSKINLRLKRNHLTTIERAKEYISGNFSRDISLMEIAEYCYVSPFHFSRIFKTFTGCSPHQFLLSIRLQYAAMLLCSGSEPVADIAYSSGFNSVENFTAAFRQRYASPPSRYRDEKSKIS